MTNIRVHLSTGDSIYYQEARAQLIEGSALEIHSEVDGKTVKTVLSPTYWRSFAEFVDDEPHVTTDISMG